MSILLFLIFTILGVIVGQALQGYAIYIIIIGVIYVLGLMFIGNREKLFIFTIAVLCGMYTGLSTIHLKNDKSFLEYRGKNIRIVANVLSTKTKNNEFYYYVVRTKSVSFKKQTRDINKKLLLVTDKKLFDKDDIYGTELRINSEVKIAKKNRNFYGFNHKRYLDSQRISGTVFSKARSIKIGEKTIHNPLVEVGYNLRFNILKMIDKLLDKDTEAIVKGILISYTDEIDVGTIESFRNMGISHILCASGINVVYLSMLVNKILKSLRIKRRYRNSFLIVILILYNLVVGFTPSLTRAVIMSILSLVGDIFFYNANSLSNLIIAAIAIIFVNPFVIYNVAFQFSFVATLFIILFLEGVEKIFDKIKINRVLNELISTSIVVYIGIMPIEIYNFNRISIVGIFINSVIGIAHSTVIFLGFIMILVGNISYILAKPIAFVVGRLVHFILIFKEEIGILSFLAIDPIYIKSEWIVIYYSLIIFGYWYKKSDRVRIFFAQKKRIIACIVFLVFSINLFIPKNFMVDFIDVGQGDCAVIKTIHGKNILIDGGEKINILDIVKTNVTKIDVMIASHGHMDHIGGLIEIVTKMNVKNLIIPNSRYLGEMNKLLNVVDKEKTKIYMLSRNDEIKLDKDTSIEFVNPIINNNIAGENDNSLVCKLKYRDISFLFTGDLTSRGEDNILGLNIKADVLKVAHHGSEYGTTKRFLEAVNPKIAVISVGENNKFNHPSTNVLKNLANKKIKIFRTDRDGQIRIITNGKKFKVIKSLS